MALNVKLRGSVSMVQVADDVLQHGGFSYTGGRFYYSYVNRAGVGIIRVSTDDGRTWYPYDHLGPVTGMAARGPWVGWGEGPNAVIYDIESQWRIVDAPPADPENFTAMTRVVPLPEIQAVHFAGDRSVGYPIAGAVKSISEFGLWDVSYPNVPTATGTFTYSTYRFLGVYGDEQPQGSGIDHVREAYLVESYYLGSPSTSHVYVAPRTDAHHGFQFTADNRVPQGPYLASGLGVQGFEGTLDGVSGIMGSQMRGPPGLGTHGRGIPPGWYSIRMAGGQVGLRNFTDVYGEDTYEWAHGGAWVDEYDTVAAFGAIGGYPGVLFRDSAGNIAMVRRSGSQFGPWSEAKVYGDPGFAPESLWMPHAYAAVRGGIFGRGEAWFLADDDPGHIPRGRLVEGDYLPPLKSEAHVEDDPLRKVTFWR